MKKISKLPKFSFYVGNTLDDMLDVVANNKGVFVDDELCAEYDSDEVENAHDLIDTIDYAINCCDNLTDEDKEELGVVLYSDVSYFIKHWWDEKVFD